MENTKKFIPTMLSKQDREVVEKILNLEDSILACNPHRFEIMFAPVTNTYLAVIYHDHRQFTVYTWVQLVIKLKDILIGTYGRKP